MTGYLRFPSIHDETVVFAAEDDLWVVSASGGDASRLTAGVGDLTTPRLSPDGELVAFVGSEEGPTEVYVMPVSGGTARRLTYQAARCTIAGWDPDTGEILYASAAGQPAAFGYRLFAVHPGGGLPRVLPFGQARALSHGSGGRSVLGRNTADPARWKRYRGGTAGELWADATGDGRFSRLAVAGNLAAPCWAGERIFFLSDSDGTGNVHSCRPDGSDLVQHTAHRDFYARNLAGDGRRLVYHNGARLHVVDTATGESHGIDVRLRTSNTQRGRKFVLAAEHLHSAVPLPDGSGIAVTARGKAYTLDNWSGPARQHGESDGVRYQLLTRLPGGERLVAICSDDGPDERLVVFDTDGTATELSAVDFGRILELEVSPVAPVVAVATSRQELYVVDFTGEPLVRRLDHCPHERIEDLAWSPDGRWLAYGYPTSALTNAIKLADVRTGETAAVTKPVHRDFAPSFDPDGRYLYFIGTRDFTATVDRIEFGLGFGWGTRPFAVALSTSVPSPFHLRQEKVDPPVCEVDFEGIERRVMAFPVPEGRYQRVLGLRGKALLLSHPIQAPPVAAAKHEPSGLVEVFDFATATAEELTTEVDDVVLSDDRSTLLCRAGLRVRMISATEEPDSGNEDEFTRKTGWVDLSRIRVSVRPAAEWRQMFREVWRLQRENFWDAGMSGVDWDAVYRRYLPLVDLVASRGELSDLIWELQGELGTSHAYESGGEYRSRPEYAQGFLGVDWSVEDGRWLIDRILTGDVWSPDVTSGCNRPGTDIRPGDAVLAINGRPVGAAGPGELLVDQAGQEVELTVSRGAGATRRVSVRALADEAPARYRDWVEANRAHVHAETGGRVGYLHVPDMTGRGYGEFVRAFLTEYDREALIVDVRFNTGGFISPLLLDKLTRPRFGQEVGRWTGAAPFPPESRRGPLSVLTNEHAGSDGDIFSHQVKRLGLGTLIGKRTWGGVVATWPRHDLADGTVTTQPEFSYVFDGVGRTLENRGVEPDIEVDPAPHEFAEGVDPQLDCAVWVLLDQLPALGRPPLAASGRVAASRSPQHRR